MALCVVELFVTGLLRPGGTVVEGTAGNTGIGLAHMCLAKGYKCVIFMPNNQSKVRTYKRFSKSNQSYSVTQIINYFFFFLCIMM